MEIWTTFYDVDGRELGSEEGIIPIPLYKGMTITLHGHMAEFEVIDWNYHVGQPDENAGLRIILQKTGAGWRAEGPEN